MRLRAPEVEQLTYYEKVVSFPSWIVLLGLVVVTGLLKAMRYVFPVPGELLWWASALHVASFVLLAAKLLDHLRYVVAPHRWPLFQAMVTTWIGERYVELRHPGWYRAIQGRRSRSAPPPAAPVSAAGSPAERGGA